MRLFISGLQKLVRRPATFVTFGLLVGLLVLIVLAVGATANSNMGAGGGPNNGAAAKELVTFPGAYDRMLEFILGLDNGIPRLRALISTAVAATNLLKVGEFEERLASLEAATGQRSGTGDDAAFPEEEPK
jgi:hypothetical protein